MKEEKLKKPQKLSSVAVKIIEHFFACHSLISGAVYWDLLALFGNQKPPEHFSWCLPPLPLPQCPAPRDPGHTHWSVHPLWNTPGAFGRPWAAGARQRCQTATERSLKGLPCSCYYGARMASSFSALLTYQSLKNVCYCITKRKHTCPSS